MTRGTASRRTVPVVRRSWAPSSAWASTFSFSCGSSALLFWDQLDHFCLADVVEQPRGPHVLHLRSQEAHPLGDDGRDGGHPFGVTLGVGVRRFEILGENLNDAQVGLAQM